MKEIFDEAEAEAVLLVDVENAFNSTQGDPVAIAVYAITTIPLVLMVMEVTKETTKSEAYADDLAAAGSLIGLKEWWNHLCITGLFIWLLP